MGIRQRIVQAVTRRKPTSPSTPTPKTSPVALPHQHSFSAIAGISDIVKDTNKLRTTSNYDNDFDIYDAGGARPGTERCSSLCITNR